MTSTAHTEVALHRLEALGFSADVVDDGFQALHALDRTPYDLVLMYCQMPEMDGYTATEHIRRHPQVADVPVIAMTAGDIAGDRERGLAAGMDDYITKPVKPDELETALSRWVGTVGGPMDATAVSGRQAVQRGPTPGSTSTASRSSDGSARAMGRSSLTSSTCCRRRRR